MNALELIATRLAAPKRYRVTTSYADGHEKHHETETLTQAENWASNERRKLGRSLIRRDTGATVRVSHVTVTTINPQS